MSAQASIQIADRETGLHVSSLFLNFGGLQVLHDINFSLAPGEVLGLIGPNGAGKSALLNCINGLYVPQPGSRIGFGGEELTGLSASRVVGLGIKRTFQHIHLVDGMSVLDNVMLGLAPVFKGGVLRRYANVWGASRQERLLRRKAQDTLDLCGIGHLAQDKAGGLPLGIRRRVDLARALVSDPRLLLLDEPASGLSAGERKLVRELVNIARRKSDIAVMWIEHDLELVISVATRILVLHHGRIVAEGDPRLSADERQALIEAYLKGERVTHHHPGDSDGGSIVARS